MITVKIEDNQNDLNQIDKFNNKAIQDIKQQNNALATHSLKNNQQNEITKPKTSNDKLTIRKKRVYKSKKRTEYICKICKMDCRSKNLQIINDREIYKCTECGKEFDKLKRKYWQIHYHTHFKERKFVCNICPSKFKTNHQLNGHRRFVHGTGYYCDICDMKLSSPFGLKIHIEAKHYNIRPYKCEICTKEFRIENNLKEHIEVDHNDKKNVCGICHNEYRSAKYLNQHMKKVHDPNFINKQYACTMCNKAYSSKANLKLHFKRHIGLKDSVCDKCGKRFLNLAALNLHKSVHDNVRQYACSVCEKRFRTRVMLRVHMSTHTGEKRFQCKQCNRRFTQRGTLTVHMRYHTGERPYPCNLCNKAFVTKTLLNMHKEKGHKLFSKIEENKLLS